MVVAYYLLQLPRIVTLKKDSEMRAALPIEVGGWLLGEFLSKKKVFIRVTFYWMEMIEFLYVLFFDFISITFMPT